MTVNLKKKRIENLESCLQEAKKIHDQILKSGIESELSRKELQDSIGQQVSIIRLLQSEARLSNAAISALTAFAGSIFGVILTAILKLQQ